MTPFKRACVCAVRCQLYPLQRGDCMCRHSPMPNKREPCPTKGRPAAGHVSKWRHCAEQTTYASARPNVLPVKEHVGPNNVNSSWKETDLEPNPQLEKQEPQGKEKQLDLHSGRTQGTFFCTFGLKEYFCVKRC